MHVRFRVTYKCLCIYSTYVHTYIIYVRTYICIYVYCTVYSLQQPTVEGSSFATGLFEELLGVEFKWT